MTFLSETQQDLFERSLHTIEAVEKLFLESQLILNTSIPNFNALKEQLQNPFSIFVCGEFNAGKSSLLNKLAEADIAKVGILPTTKEIHPYTSTEFNGLVFIDSPGTNSIITEHQKLTENYLQQADIILFITSIERPLSKSEKDFLDIVNQTWLRKVIFVINKIDLVTEEEKQEVLKFVDEGLESIFQDKPHIFTVSSRSGLGIDQLRNFLFSLLGETEKVKLKLQGPQSSLLVYLEKLEAQNTLEREKIILEKNILDQAINRIAERLEEFDLLFTIYKQKIVDVFSSLVEQLYQLIDDNFAFFILLRRRFFKEEDLFEERLSKQIKEAKLNEKMELVVQQIIDTFLKYREKIITEAQQELALASNISHVPVAINSINLADINVADLSEGLKLSAEEAFKKSLTLGTVAAATGIGAQIVSSAAFFDLSALAIAGVLAMSSANAVPKQRDRAKYQIYETFQEFQQSYSENLENNLAQELQKCFQQFKSSIQPRLTQLQEKLDKTEAFAEEIKRQRQEIQAILDKVDFISIEPG